MRYVNVVNNKKIIPLKTFPCHVSNTKLSIGIGKVKLGPIAWTHSEPEPGQLSTSALSVKTISNNMSYLFNFLTLF